MTEAKNWYDVACSGSTPHLDAMFNLASIQYDELEGKVVVDKIVMNCGDAAIFIGC